MERKIALIILIVFVLLVAMSVVMTLPQKNSQEDTSVVEPAVEENETHIFNLTGLGGDGGGS